MQNIKKYVNYNEEEHNIYIPNEIFEDFQNDERIEETNIPFAFSYYYLINYLYRYCKYQDGSFYTNNELKEMLGMSAGTKSVNYLIIKGGVLEQMGYIETTRYVPTSWSYGERPHLQVYRDLSFDYWHQDEEWKEYIAPLPKKYTIKRPIKAFQREAEEELHPVVDDIGDFNFELFDGTYFDISNTTYYPFEAFAFCMERKDLGCRGFYLYCYIHYKDQYFGGKGYDVAFSTLAAETKMPHSTFSKVMSALKKHGTIDTIHNQEYFCLGMDKEDRKANTYQAVDPDFFEDQGTKKVQKMKVVSVETHKKEMEKRTKQKKDNADVQVDLDSLPF